MAKVWVIDVICDPTETPSPPTLYRLRVIGWLKVPPPAQSLLNQAPVLQAQSSIVTTTVCTIPVLEGSSATWLPISDISAAW